LIVRDPTRGLDWSASARDGLGDRSANSVHDRWQRIACAPEDSYTLADASLLIAAEEYPNLNPTAYVKKLDQLAARVSERIGSNAGAEETVAAMNRVIFEEEGFSGNTVDYYDPRNSYLNEVLDRKLGIPITLSVVYMETGTRVGLPIAGVGFPGHFLVKCTTGDDHLILDPYAGGSALSAEELDQRLRQVYGEVAPSVTQSPELLAPATKKQILLRMLRNLKNIFGSRDEDRRVLELLNKILELHPNSLEELRERATLYERFECYRSALKDLERCRDLAGAGGDNETQDVLRRLRTVLSSYH